MCLLNVLQSYIRWCGDHFPLLFWCALPVMIVISGLMMRRDLDFADGVSGTIMFGALAVVFGILFAGMLPVLPLLALVALPLLFLFWIIGLIFRAR